MSDIVLTHEQVRDAAFLASRTFAGDFSLPGAGKTLTALEAADLVFDEDPDLRGSIVIIGPPISLAMWASVAHDWLHGQYEEMAIMVARSSKDLSDALRYDVLIMSYEIAVRNIDLLKGFSPDILICDEAHALKSTSAKRTKAILGAGGLVEYAGWAWMLTGTPSTRWNDDMIPFLSRADKAGFKDRVGGLSIDKFNLRYCVTQLRKMPGMRFPIKMIVGNRNTDELNEWLFGDDQLACRRDLKAMPPLTTSVLEVPLNKSPNLRQALKAMDTMSTRELEESVARKDPALSTVMRLTGEAKIKASAAEIRSRLDAGDKPLLVGAWHTSVIDALVEELGDEWGVAVIDGRTSARERAEIEAQWNANEIDVLVGQVLAMGVSLNLQLGGAHRIITIEQDWSPDVMDQFYARLRRTGQVNNVHVDIFRGEGAKLEKAQMSIQNRKRREHVKLLAQEEN